MMLSIAIEAPWVSDSNPSLRVELLGIKSMAVFHPSNTFPTQRDFSYILYHDHIGHSDSTGV
jgi:hypothetical protein